MSQLSLDTLLAEGTLAGQAGDFDHAIACFRAALKLAPQHPGIMLYLAKAHGLSFQYKEAEKWTQEALRLAPQNLQVLRLAVGNFQEWDCPERALPLLHRLAGAHPNGAEAWVELGRALERANQTDAARDAIARAARLSPADSRVLRLRARLEERAGNFGEAAGLLAEALNQKPGAEEETGILYAQASVLDAQGEYGRAWDSVVRAKSLQRPLAQTLCESGQAFRDEIGRFQAGLPTLADEESDLATRTQLAVALRLSSLWHDSPGPGPSRSSGCKLCR